MPATSLNDHAILHRRQAARIGAWSRFYVILVVAGLIAVLGRVVQLKVWPDARLSSVAGSTDSSRAELERRGCLLDRRGRVIATSTAGYRLFVDPQFVRDPATIAVELAKLLGTDPIPIDMEISRRGDSQYVVIADLLESWQVDAVRQANLRGVGLEPRLVRHYPNGDLARGVIGTVGFEHNGLGGFEHAFERRLQQTDGRITYLRDARRRPMWISPAGYRRGESGDDIALSIDLVVQEIVERRLREAVEKRNAGGGRIVVLDSTTGEILAMADVLQSREGWDEQTSDPLRDENAALARNRCVTDPYEPGSTFKPFIWAVATHQGRATPDEVLPTPASCCYRTSRGRRIRDTTYHESVDWLTVLVKSINSGMAMVAERMSHVEMQEAVTRFGFGQRTRCGVRGESPGLVTSPAKWSHYTQTSVCMGHEIAVTPLQMVRAFSVFARDGTMPMLRVRGTGPRGDEYRVVDRILPPDIAMTVRESLAQVVTRGTAQRARSDLYRLFGKSGTAQLPKKEGGGYHEHRYVSSFIAGAPFDDPRVVVLCVIDDPDRSKGHFGGTIAGPVVRDVIDETLTYLGVEPDQESDQPSTVRDQPAASGDDEEYVF